MRIIKDGKKDLVMFECQECGCIFEIDMLNGDDLEKYVKADCEQLFYICPKCASDMTTELTNG